MDAFTAKYDAAEQRVLLYLAAEYPNYLAFQGDTSNRLSLNDYALLQGEKPIGRIFSPSKKAAVIEQCQLDEPAYQRIVSKLQTLEIVTVDSPGSLVEFVRIKPLIKKVVLHLEQRDLVAETKAKLHRQRWYVWLWIGGGILWAVAGLIALYFQIAKLFGR